MKSLKAWKTKSSPCLTWRQRQKGARFTGFKGTLENSPKQFVTVGYTIAYKTSLEKPKPQNTNKKSVKTLYSVQNSFLDLTNLFEVE